MDFLPTAFPEAPVRAEDLEYIVGCISRGECCAVVGPSNTGKSLLLKSLLMEEVRQHCAREGTQPPMMVFVDCLEAGDSEQAFYELLLRRVVDELRDSGVSASTVDTLRTSHTELLHSTTDVAVRSLFASSMRELGRERGTALVLILDEFDDVFCALPPWPFRQLRALRDALGAWLCYVTATSHHLERLRSDAETYEFRELFHLHTRILRPLSEEDTRRFVAYLSTKHGAALDDRRISTAIELSGGHPGLLERIYTILKDIGPDLTARRQITAAELSGKQAIQKECRRLWEELEEQEQEGLLALIGVGEPALDAEHRQALEAKGLVVARESEGLIAFSSVFEVFVRQELRSRHQVRMRGVHCDPQTGQIWVDGREMTLELSETQRKLVRFLCQKAGAACSQDEIAEVVWGAGEGVSPGAIYELVKRVRQKLEPDWKNPRYIVTVSGIGYRLHTPEE